MKNIDIKRFGNSPEFLEAAKSPTNKARQNDFLDVDKMLLEASEPNSALFREKNKGESLLIPRGM